MAEQRTLDIDLRDGLPTFTRTLPRARESAADARRLVGQLLDVWELGDLADDAALILDELVANSADHARGNSIRVTVVRQEHAVVRLAVVDLDRTKPRVVCTAPDAEGGRGLRLVEALSRQWGVDLLPWGKRTWAELGAP